MKYATRKYYIKRIHLKWQLAPIIMYVGRPFIIFRGIVDAAGAHVDARNAVEPAHEFCGQQPYATADVEEATVPRTKPARPNY